VWFACRVKALRRSEEELVVHGVYSRRHVASAIVSFKTRAVPEQMPVSSIIQVESDNGRVLSLSVRFYLFLANPENTAWFFQTP